MGRMSVIDSDASLRMMGLSSLIEQGKNNFRRSSKALKIQTANGMVTSDTHAKVYVRELGTFLWVYLVENSPSVIIGMTSH